MIRKGSLYVRFSQERRRGSNYEITVLGKDGKQVNTKNLHSGRGLYTFQTGPRDMFRLGGKEFGRPVGQSTLDPTPPLTSIAIQ